MWIALANSFTAATGAEVATPDGEAENLAIGEGVSK